MASTINASTSGVGGVITTADATGVLDLQTADVTRASVSSSGLKISRVDSSNEGGQLDLCRSSDNTSAWAIDVYGNTSTPSLRFVDNVAAAARMVVDGSGNVGIGTASPAAKFQIESSADTTFRQVKTGQSDWAQQTLDSGVWRLYSYTAGAERMRIDSDGNVNIGKTAPSTSVAGTTIYSVGAVEVVRNAEVCYVANRLTNDGDLFRFYQAGTLEGTISVSGTTVSYNGGHLSRWSQLYNETTKVEVYRGTVLESVDAMCEWYDAEVNLLPNEQCTKTIVSTTPASKAVAGVFDRYDEDDEDNPYDFYVAQSGDFVIRVAAGTVVQNGDLLESAGNGTAKVQADDICRSSTIAKVTSNYVSETYADGSFCVPCILMIG